MMSKIYFTLTGKNRLPEPDGKTSGSDTLFTV